MHLFYILNFTTKVQMYVCSKSETEIIFSKRFFTFRLFFILCECVLLTLLKMPFRSQLINFLKTISEEISIHMIQ